MTDFLWEPAISAVAFDMDGLMVNTEELYTTVGETILERRGHQFTAELKNEMMGLPGDVAWQVMIDAHRLTDSPAELDAECEVIFADLLPSRLQAMPGLMDLLAFLEEHDIPRCVATSSSHRFAERVLGQIQVLQRVAFVVTAEDVPRGKPHPDIYLEAARRMEVASNEMLVLEDSHHGTRAGIAANACTIAVPGEHSRNHDFSGVHAVADSLADDLIRKQLRI